jgi:NADH:ubiquinone oxidoreductase subunit E
VLQEIQQENNYLPREALELVAQRLQIPRGQVYEIATFYRSFSLKPKGKYRVRVCLGTACHVHGGPHILEAFERQLKIKAGESTPDGLFSLEASSCLGACAQAPYVQVNEEPHNQVTPVRVSDVVKQYAGGGNGRGA